MFTSPRWESPITVAISRNNKVSLGSIDPPLRIAATTGGLHCDAKTIPRRNDEGFVALPRLRVKTLTQVAGAA
jgi:hypothetical protein